MTKFSSLLTSVFLLLSAAATDAQVPSASIQGRVTDSSGGVLQGASVTLQPGGEHTVTGDEGQYAIAGLAPGTYALTVSFVGFQPFERSIEVSTGQTVHVDPVVEVEGQSAKVFVTARPRGEVEQIR